jgi:hypothetical protein
MVGDYRGGGIRNVSASSAQYQHFKNYRRLPSTTFSILPLLVHCEISWKPIPYLLTKAVALWSLFHIISCSVPKKTFLLSVSLCSA